ncbi:sorbosone dehydrogenase family protein [Xanthomonas rydalmerensis]|uniref:Sorbosone dehydrogenase family protein n=1 Tax=Xanthomonas rydalmerensis TaxID=3046274 RepID=A0ABZ0JP20_9XANT|nr:sorbosone dehydrogenase family protein [Xanthomonas sp. DM-2023]WOS41544.1 sorbosone dehydrogenase family protein [Xanthomonas sp. DM-2023]WOS45729.1 sorbosone dehydrogenase family protein [Xanthomonas sp. DM-2023]WOS49909.1 sorbosone dehydrogenase family protein [Xanthomonas sp. DM-2023]WOS54088.1 sorbosone dehydrogenase family protein [Xanthomonas sp. DM-2023]WOS58271.1 sorbosone dehydrogenase family protein [Xanthomonas sp. DM-2023]
MAKRLCMSAVALACAISLAACGGKAALEPAQQSGNAPPLPEARNFLLPPMQVPEGVGWKEGQTPKVAAGLKIEKIAGGLMHPRQLYVLPNDDVLVVESNSPGMEPVTTPKQLIAGLIQGRSGKSAKGGNRITLLRRAADGTWERHVFLQGLHSPFGVQLIGDSLYVANTDAIMKFPYVAGQTQISAAGTLFTDLPGTIEHHWTKALLASQDGRKLYVGVGSNSNIGENGLDVEYRRAAVLEVDVASASSRIFASGIRNPTGLQWEPRTGRLWAIANERDEIGADLVPDYLTSVQEGGFYGWPYSYYGQNVDTRVKEQRPDLVAKAIKPDYALGSHVAALGLWFTRGETLPAKYREGAFVAEHGSWNRSPLSGYQVVYVPFQHGRPAGPPQTVVSGFHSEDESQLFGAPVGLAQDKDGALLIADDVGNSVWRVSF